MGVKTSKKRKGGKRKDEKEAIIKIHKVKNVSHDSEIKLGFKLSYYYAVSRAIIFLMYFDNYKVWVIFI